MKPIRFYPASGPFGFLSNFSRHPITIRGVTWPTSEHFFQAQKFAGKEHQEAIRALKSPTVAARMGRSRKRPLRADWEEVKESVMLEALRAKFTQHSDIQTALIETGPAPLMEHTENDRYWGDGGDGSGKNRLGVLLEQARGEIVDALAHARAWESVMKPGRGWASFLFGTCVVVTSETNDVTAHAQRILAEYGPMQVGTPSADFNVQAMRDDFGWMVTGDHPDVLVRVAPRSQSTSDLAAGLAGRSARAEDARTLVVVRAVAAS